MNARDAVKIIIWVLLIGLIFILAVIDPLVALATFGLSVIVLSRGFYEPIWVRANQTLIIAGKMDDVIYDVIDQPRLYWRFRLLDKVAATLSSAPVALDDRAHAVRSADGVPFEVRYRLLYRIDLSEYDPNLLTQTVSFLDNPKVGLLAQAEHYLRLAFACFNADQILQARFRQPIIEEFRAAMEDPFKKQGFALTVVNLREFAAPADYQSTQLAARGRRIENEATIEAYNNLARGTRNLNVEDRSLVIASEKLRILNHMHSNTVLHLPYGDDGWTPLG